MPDSKPTKKKLSPFGWFASRQKRRAGRRIHAHVSHDHDWQTEVPNMKLSRAFCVVLALHVVAVGGILAYELLKDDHIVPSSARSAVATAAAASAAAKTTEHRITEASTAALSGIETRPYQVVSGDSVSRIAAKVGATTAEIVRLNGLNAGTELYPGLRLKVPVQSDGGARDAQAEALLEEPEPDAPAPIEKPLPEARPSPTAESPGVPVARPVQKPVVQDSPPIPPRDPAPEERPGATPSGSISFLEYTVKKGDTLYSLGRAHGVSSDAITRANGLSGSSIRIGQVLRIPRVNN